MAEIRYECHRLDTQEVVHCYVDEFYPLSNFSPFRVYYKGFDYDTSEHAYQASKFDDPMLKQSIRQARSAHNAFQIASDFADRLPPNWRQIRADVMLEILASKFDQHEYVQRKLRQTGRRRIVEDSWRDSYWGIGPNGDGENMLGVLWERIREKQFGY